MNGWQPVEPIGELGKPVLGWNFYHGMQVIRWTFYHDWIIDLPCADESEDEEVLKFNPTHWMPLPEPPE